MIAKMSSCQINFLFNINGSSKETNKDAVARQVNATDTFDAFIEP